LRTDAPGLTLVITAPGYALSVDAFGGGTLAKDIFARLTLQVELMPDADAGAVG